MKMLDLLSPENEKEGREEEDEEDSTSIRANVGLLRDIDRRHTLPERVAVTCSTDNGKDRKNSNGPGRPAGSSCCCDIVLRFQNRAAVQVTTHLDFLSLKLFLSRT